MLTRPCFYNHLHARCWQCLLFTTRSCVLALRCSRGYLNSCSARVSKSLLIPTLGAFTLRRHRSTIHHTPSTDFFAYTSGRFLYNEKLRLAEICVEFNVDALKHVAANCTGRKGVAQMRKLVEGGFNRIFSSYHGRRIRGRGQKFHIRLPSQGSL